VSADDTTLLTIEQRIRSQVTARLGTVVTHFGAYLAAAIREHSTLSGGELISRPDVYGALSTTLDAAQESIENTVRAGYGASSRAAQVSATRDLAAYQYTVPERLPDQGEHLAAILATVAVAFVMARNDIQQSIQAGYDGVAGTAANAARVLVAHEALSRAVRRLGVKATAAAVVAVHRGFTDAQQAIYAAYAAAHPGAQLTKRWVARSDNPCPACRALHGTVIDLHAEFDHATTTDPTQKPPPVFGALHGPPRHPNCRCRIVIELSEATAALRQQVAARPPGRTPRRLAAADVRRMPLARFRALTAFFAVTARRVMDLVRKAASGG